jgi:hypothetical protein
MADRLGKTDEQRILHALDRAVDDVHDGCEPDDAIVKAAREADLPPGHVRLMVHAFNRGRANTQRKNGETVFDKASSVALARIENITEKLFPAPEIVKRAAAASVVSEDYSLPPSWMRDPRLDRTRELLPEPAEVDVPRGRLEKRASVALAQVDREVAALGQGAMEAAERANRELADLETYFRKEGSAWFESCRELAEAGYGSRGADLFAAIGVTLAGLPKTASFASRRLAAIDPAQHPWRGVNRFIKAATEHAELRAKSAALEADPEVGRLRSLTAGGQARATVKEAAGLDPSPAPGPKERATGSFLNRLSSGATGGFGSALGSISAPIANQLTRLSGGTVADPSRATLEEKAYGNLTDPVHELHVRQIQTKAVLHDLLANDPVISGHDPDEVVKYFNDLQRLAPRTVGQPALMRAVLRKQLAQGQLDTHDLGQIAEIEKNLRQAREPAKAPDKSPSKPSIPSPR